MLPHAIDRSFPLLLSSVLLAAAPARAQELQWAQNPGNGRWYGIPAAPSTWTAGESLAVAQGCHLATIRSAGENAWIATTFAGFNANGYWIGFNDVAVKGTIVWTSGEPVTYTNWNPGEPNNSGGVQDAAKLLPGSSWRWDDVNPADLGNTPIAERASAPLVGWSLPERTSVQDQPSALAVGDLNGDGRLDVIVPNRGSGSLSILLGQASGSLAAPSNVACAGGPVAVVVGRFNDGPELDVAVACYDAQLVRVLFGNGSGAFGSSVDLPLGARPISIATAQFDGDGRADLALTTIDSQDRLRVLRSSGSGAFLPQEVYPTGSRPVAVTAGDLDGDGDADLAVANFDSDDASLYVNQGNGLFLTGPLLSNNNGPSRIAIGDFNGDGKADLAIPMRLDGLVRFAWGLGGGAFDSVGPLYAAGVEPAWAEAADVDRDGRLDLVVAAFASDALEVFRATGDGFFSGPVELLCGDGPACVAAVQVGGDARPELVASALNADQVVVLRNLARDCNGNAVDDTTDIALGTSRDCNHNGIPDECDLTQGATYDCDGNGAVDSCEIAADAALDLDHDAMLDACEVAGTPYCFGDGSAAACPCDPGQVGAPGTGCLNSAGTGGRLVAVGNASVAADSVSLRASGLVPSSVGLFFQGNLQQNAGLGTPFGDGLLCANQAVIRLEIRTASGGAMAFGRDVPGDPPVAQDGSVPAAGATRYYQVWYRDAVNFCTTATYNLTNGVRIAWQP